MVLDGRSETPVPRRDPVGAGFTSGRPILELEGVGLDGDAERLAGAELRLPAAALGTLPEGTFHHHDADRMRGARPGRGRCSAGCVRWKDRWSAAGWW